MGQSYAVTVGSEMQRNGMHLEVEDNSKAVRAEVFYSDRDNSMTSLANAPICRCPLSNG